MAPSGYVQVDPPKQRKGIIRPGAVHLNLPLVERHSQAYGGSEENLLSSVSSHWTISAAPKSSASLYSQASYTTSPPPVFRENNLDRRRFGITKTPALDGPWSRPVQLDSPATSTFVLDLKSALTLSDDPFMVEGEELDDEEDLKKELLDGGIVALEVKKSETPAPELEKASKETANARMKKLRMSTKVLGKMLSRLSVHQSTSRRVNTDEAPLLPPIAPQILISLPSPGLKMPSSPKEDVVVKKDDLRAFVLEKHTDIPRNRSTMPSTWKPRRPPSPLPKSLRRHGKHKSEMSGLSHLVLTSPPPPLPVRRQIQSTLLLESPKVPFSSFSTPLNSDVDTKATSPSWADIQTRLKARASKSSTYAIHNGGMISPTSS
ncbi:hypothetical protein DXG01_009491 [Tephrocybe rancida]|nr:hypothetical protein DXG01_009491 [Tephrocybe rancida]